jgi:pyrimidine-nucleoside phosphorylase/thymidine phosphorylase
MAAAQGGNVAAFERPAQAALTVASPSEGFVTAIDGRAIGENIASLKSIADANSGARIGIRLQKTVGDAVEKGEPLCLVFAGEGAQRLGRVALEAMTITRNPPARGPAVIERLRAEPS